MHIQELIRQIWEEVRATKHPKVQDFLKYLEHAEVEPEQCWAYCIKEFRRHYYDLFDLAVPPLLQSDDKLLRVSLIRHADLSKPKEVALLKKLAKTLSATKDEPELREIARLGHKDLRNVLAKRRDLTIEVRQIIQPQPTRLPRAANIVAPPPKKPSKKTVPPK